MIAIRLEQPGDIETVHAINEVVFGQPTEANIVDSLRRSCPEAVSLVAVEGSKVLGHVFFSPVAVSLGGRTIPGMGLGPMAVRPDRQCQGIGSKLAFAGIEILRERKCPFIIVLGHPEYYPRFGFVPASRHGLACQWPAVPDDVFMTLVLDEAAMAGVSGTARYRPEFDPAK